MMSDFLRELNPDMWVTNENFYQEIILGLPDWKEIPSIHLAKAHNFPDGTLVRFRGMVQDMRGPEVYFHRLEVYNAYTHGVQVRLGRYKDGCPIYENEKVSHVDVGESSQRFPLVVISMPGLTDWARKEEELINRRALQGFISAKPFLPELEEEVACIKRRLEEEEDMFDDEMKSLDLSCSPEKKPMVENIEKVEEKLEEKVEEKLEEMIEEKEEEIVEESPELEFSVEHYLNHPLPGIENHTCIFKLYREANYIKLNDMVEAIGFLSADPSMSGRNQFHELLHPDSREEILTHNPPPDLIPRLHVIAIKRLEHSNPLVDSTIDQDKVLSEAVNFYDNMMNVMTGLMLGDTLAAQYMVCYLVSHVYIRRDTRSIGPLNLNVTHLPMEKLPNYVTRVYEVFEQLVHKSFYIPLSVDTLNTTNFLPRKDLVCNRLESGVLQLSTDTHLFLDETVMRAGRLNENGFHNIAALVKLIGTQRVEYSYKFFDMEVDADVPVCVFSEGKTLLPSDCVVPLQADPSSVEIFEATHQAICQYLKGDVVTQLRSYLTSVKLLRFIMPEDIKFVEEDFVAMRAAATPQQPVTEDDLHRLLVLSRLLALAQGRDRMDQAAWEQAKQMDALRLARLSQIKTRNNA